MRFRIPQIVGIGRERHQINPKRGRGIMNTTAERINRETYERHVARARLHIAAKGLCIEIGSIIDALQMENDLLLTEGSNFERMPIYKNRDHAIRVLTAVQKALDLNYQSARFIDRQRSLDALMSELEGL
jgi:hypothetical protein